MSLAMAGGLLTDTLKPPGSAGTVGARSRFNATLGFQSTMGRSLEQREPERSVTWQRKKPSEWTALEVRDFLESVLPGHGAVERLSHMSGRVLASLSKDELRRASLDEEAANVIWAELARLSGIHQEHDEITRKRGEDPFTLFIRTPADVAVELEVLATDTVKEIKERVSRVEGTAVGMQRLMWNGMPMMDTRTLASYSIVHGSVVLMVPRLGAGVAGGGNAGNRYAAGGRHAYGSSAPVDVATPSAPSYSSGAYGAGLGGSGLPRPKVPVACHDLARPFPMSLEFASIPEYQAFMVALQRQSGRKEMSSRVAIRSSADSNDGGAVPFLEILPLDNMRGSVQTRIIFDAEAEVLLIDTCGDILMECTRYRVLLHLKDDQKVAHLVTGMLTER